MKEEATSLEMIRRVSDFIDRYDGFIVAGHKEPDGDCLGSQLAMASWLHRIGKATWLVSAGPFKRVEVKVWENLFLNQVPDGIDREHVAVILLDCTGIDRSGELAEHLSAFPLAVIDHHATSSHATEAVYVDPSSPATTCLVQNLIEYRGDMITQNEAEALFFGLSTDTGFFRHLDSGSGEVFSSAARLVDSGASPKSTFARMNGGKSVASRKLMGIMLQRLESHFDGRLYVSWETIEDTETYGLEGRDSDSLYQLIQAISGCEAIVLIRQESPERCTVGLRSRDRVDVASIAARMGGGGHHNAAGLSVEGKIDSVKLRLLDAFAVAFR